jgi:nucleoside-diphosphate-sugar epimerase
LISIQEKQGRGMELAEWEGVDGAAASDNRADQDASKARGHLGWTPRICALDEIIRTAWVWHQRQERAAS